MYYNIKSDTIINRNNRYIIKKNKVKKKKIF